MGRVKPRCFEREGKKKGARIGHHRPFILAVITCTVVSHVCSQSGPVTRIPQSDASVGNTRQGPSALVGAEANRAKSPSLSDPAEVNSGHETGSQTPVPAGESDSDGSPPVPAVPATTSTVRDRTSKPLSPAVPATTSTVRERTSKLLSPAVPATTSTVRDRTSKLLSPAVPDTTSTVRDRTSKPLSPAVPDTTSTVRDRTSKPLSPAVPATTSTARDRTSKPLSPAVPDTTSTVRDRTSKPLSPAAELTATEENGSTPSTNVGDSVSDTDRPLSPVNESHTAPVAKPDLPDTPEVIGFHEESVENPTVAGHAVSDEIQSPSTVTESDPTGASRLPHSDPTEFDTVYDISSKHRPVRANRTMSHSRQSRSVISGPYWRAPGLPPTNTIDPITAKETTYPDPPTAAETGCAHCNWDRVHRQSFHLTGINGHVAWTEPARSCSCVQEISWHIKPAQDDLGIVLHFLHYSLKWYENLDVYGGDQRNVDKLIGRHPALNTSVRLLPFTEITVWVRAMPWPFYIVENDPSSFSLNYTTHPLHLLPIPSPTAEIKDLVAPFFAEHFVYDCSSGTIPDYIRCDMVQQCLKGEDEPADCAYKSESCSPLWFPLHHRCLRVVITTRPGPLFSCEQLPGGKLAILPEPEARKLLGMVIARTGISKACLAVNLKNARVSSTSHQMKTQYRHILQWGGGIMNHGDPLPRRVQKDSNFGLIFSRGEIQTTVFGSECLWGEESGLLCMKTNGFSDVRVMNVSRTVTLSTHSNKSSSPALKHSIHFLKQCEDGSLVFHFQPCPQKDNDQLLSPNNFTLFDCTVDGQVHYSFVCDGHMDCEDGSDEMGCDVSTAGTSNQSLFCANGQSTFLSKGCDGVPDCLDQSDEWRCTTCANGSQMCPGFGCRPPSYACSLPCDTSAMDEAQSAYELHAPFADIYEKVSNTSTRSNSVHLVIAVHYEDIRSKLVDLLKHTLLTLERARAHVQVSILLLEGRYVWRLPPTRWERSNRRYLRHLFETLRQDQMERVSNPVVIVSEAVDMFSKFPEDRGVSKVILVVASDALFVSDSNSWEAERAKAKGIHIIGVGLRLKDTFALRKMVSQPLQENLFLMQTVDGVTEVLYKIMFATLPHGSLRPLVDTDINDMPNVAKWKRLALSNIVASGMSTVDGSGLRDCKHTILEDKALNLDLVGLFDVHSVRFVFEIQNGDSPEVFLSETPDQHNKTKCRDQSSDRMGLNCQRPIRARYVTPSFGLDAVCDVQVFGTPVLESWRLPNYKQPPAVVHMDGSGMSTTQALGEGENTCPETHFQCSEGYCVPTYLLNNGVTDCPLGDDEDISDLTCPGFFRCSDSGVCLHTDYLCDGVNHCPFNDDERYCDEEQCPEHCVCEGLAFHCQSDIDYQICYKLRYLSFYGTNDPDLKDIEVLRYLQYLNLSSCQLVNVTLDSLNNLHVLDLSYNNITSFDSLQLRHLSELTHLDLSHNPLLHVLNSTFSNFVWRAGVLKLKSLKMVGVGLEKIAKEGLHGLKLLSVLNIRDNPLHTLQSEVFGQSLQVLYTDNPKWCCSHFRLSEWIECHAPVDELSSCDDLLRSDVLRVLLWLLSIMALTGNVGVWIFRTIFEKQGASLPYRILVLNLSAADFLMGVYMTILGVADIIFHGIYVQKEEQWRHSVACKTAGFLAMLSSEMSAFVMCLITLDRLILLRFPYSFRFHATRLSSSIACSVAWLTAAVLAALPLFLPHWKFYSQNSICLPLPISRQQFPGQQYAFGVFIILNFLLFLVIAAGQLVIYRTIRQSSRAVCKDTQKQEVTIARRLFLIVFTDFCCWFPIGLMGLLAARDTHIPNIVNVWAAVFVMPLNSAINPFLYTLNTFLDRRAKRRKEKQIKKILDTLKGGLRSWPVEKAIKLVHMCLEVGSVSERDLLQLTNYCPVTIEDIQNLELVENHLEGGSVGQEEALKIMHHFLGFIVQERVAVAHQKKSSVHTHNDCASTSSNTKTTTASQ